MIAERRRLPTPETAVTQIRRITVTSGTFGALMRNMRIAAGLSQIEVASRSGLYQTHVSSLEVGSRTPSRAVVLALAEALALGVSETDRWLSTAGFAPQTDYQTLYEAEHGPIDDHVKWCWACQTERPVSRFSRDRSRRDGRHPVCRSCKAAQWQDYQKRSILGRRGGRR